MHVFGALTLLEASFVPPLFFCCSLDTLLDGDYIFSALKKIKISKKVICLACYPWLS